MRAQIWLDLDEYVVLTENTRYMHDATPLMNVFLSGARKGIVNQELLHAINSRVCVNEKAARREAGPDAVWIAHENKKKIGIVGFWDSPKVSLRITEMVENRKIRIREK